MDLRNKLLSQVSEYFTNKFNEFGESPQGVDWNGAESQYIRFRQLSKIIQNNDFSLNDLGSGYGAIIDYLDSIYSKFSYSGFDVSESIVNAAKLRYFDRQNTNFSVSSRPISVSDYSVASGIFNAHLGCSHSNWQKYMEETVDALFEYSEKAFSFNCLTTYSDAEKMREDLFYSDPCFWFDRCKKRYSREVALLHDYGLFEFTILVRKK